MKQININKWLMNGCFLLISISLINRPLSAATLISGLYNQTTHDYQKHLLEHENSLFKQSHFFEGNYKLDSAGFGIVIYKEGVQEPILNKFTKKFHHMDEIEQKVFLPREPALAFLAHLNVNHSNSFDGIKSQNQLNKKLADSRNLSPLVYKNWSFAKDGYIVDFADKIFDLRQQIPDNIKRELIDTGDGELDSKFIFALLLSNLENHNDPSNKEIKIALEKTFEQIYQVSKKSQMSILLSNGKISFAAVSKNKLSDLNSSLFYHKSAEGVVFATHPTFISEEWQEAERSKLYIARAKLKHNQRANNARIKFKAMNLKLPAFLEKEYRELQKQEKELQLLVN